MTKLFALVLLAVISLSAGYCDGCKKPVALNGGPGLAAGSAQLGR